MDFYKIKRIPVKRGKETWIDIVPEFIVRKSDDIMVRGGNFYAIWDEQEGLWSTNEYKVQAIVDEELANAVEKDDNCRVKYMADYSSKSWKEFKSYISNVPDNYHQLDDELTFSDQVVLKKDYVSKRLPYSLKEGSIDAYDEIIGTLYDELERAKIEWAIGSIFAGESKEIQKFLVLYGEAGAGKSTILNIIQWLFEGYYAIFEARTLTSNNNSFAMEMFRDNPLVAIQHDGDLSKIEDNTKLNSIVSHEEMTVNEKFKASYTARMNCFLFMATNKPVKITDAKSGIIRRLIDVTPSGRKIEFDRYLKLMSQVKFELGAIAHHCLQVYKAMGKDYYSNYRPINMMFKTDVFFNFVEDCYPVFTEQDGTTLKAAFAMYKEYSKDSENGYILPMYKFREELKNYFYEFHDRIRLNDDKNQTRSYFKGFKKDLFDGKPSVPERPNDVDENPFIFEDSDLDVICSNCRAQYANANGTPKKKWDNVTTTLKDIDTHELHYVKLPENHIVIDFDIRGEDGEKSLEKNLEAIKNWPPTYGELSKSGKGIHLHYIYDGDPQQLSRVYSDSVEIKVFSGNSSLRRKVIKCNNLPIETIGSGLPLKEVKRVLNFNSVQSEKGIRNLIKKNLRKEIHPGTKPSIDFIYKILEDAYESGIPYDVTDMHDAILAFATNSTNQSAYCIKLVGKMKFKSEEESQPFDDPEGELVFYDVEVFPNLFLVNWKIDGPEHLCVRMINPTPEDIERLLRCKLVGFNCRRYDNHILYARYIGYNNEQLYKLSQKIVSGDRNAFFGEAYNISYTDVYDFSSKKQSLKKWEIELGLHHQELGLPWDKPVPKERWVEVAEYCDNDVISTEAVFRHCSADWMARQILADLAEMTVNDTTNSLTTRIIFGRNRKPQGEFNYRNLAKPVKELDKDMMDFLKFAAPEMMSQTHGEVESLLPYFPGYKFDAGKSTYRDEEVGEGGYVYAEPGMYTDVALLDIASMHPHSAVDEVLFGVQYTKRFKELLDGRIDFKHEDWDKINDILDGKLTKYVDDVKQGKIKSSELAFALKIAINSVYGLTSASFDNAFRDKRNKDNIVAKRGALFMIDLKHAVQEKGFTVAHIKTDSIKIPNATKEIIDFVIEFGKKYGYYFEHEATYDRMCLVNDAVYIARYDTGEWTATGAQFAHPYVFKKLFSGEAIEFEDMCETKSVTSALYLDMNEALPEDEHNYVFVGRVGRFCPIQSGHGGGLLMREQNGKYYAATGTKGFRWLESETVSTLKEEDYIDRSYFGKLVDDAVENISKYGDFEWFTQDDLPILPF